MGGYWPEPAFPIQFGSWKMRRKGRFCPAEKEVMARSPCWTVWALAHRSVHRTGNWWAKLYKKHPSCARI